MPTNSDDKEMKSLMTLARSWPTEQIKQTSLVASGQAVGGRAWRKWRSGSEPGSGEMLQNGGCGVPRK